MPDSIQILNSLPQPKMSSASGMWAKPVSMISIVKPTLTTGTMGVAQQRITLAPKAMSHYSQSATKLDAQEDLLKDCEEYNCSGIITFIHKPSGAFYMTCPVCQALCTRSTLSPHLQRAHEVSYIACSGDECAGIRCKTAEYAVHLNKVHATAFCTLCEVHFDINRGYASHMVRTDLHARSDTILLPKSIRSKLKLQAPKPLSSPAPEMHTEFVSLNFRSRPRPAAILMNGDIILIDGIKYLLKDTLPFLECPMCEKIVALPALGAHLRVDHGQEWFRCPAQICRTAIESETCLNHFLGQHGAYTCKNCLRLVFLHETKAHVKSKCQITVQLRTVPKAITVQEWKGQSEKQVMVTCAYCLEPVADAKYRTHVQEHHEPHITCGICQGVIRRSDFWSHVQVDHDGETSRSEGCLICGESVTKMRTHLQLEHDLSGEAASLVTQNFHGDLAKRARIMLPRCDDTDVE